jgi:hypothetical protein
MPRRVGERHDQGEIGLLTVLAARHGPEDGHALDAQLVQLALMRAERVDHVVAVSWCSCALPSRRHTAELGLCDCVGRETRHAAPPSARRCCSLSCRPGAFFRE